MPAVSIDFGSEGCLKASQKNKKQNNLAAVMKHNGRLFAMSDDEMDFYGLAPENVDVSRSHLNKYYVNPDFSNGYNIPDYDFALKTLVTSTKKTRHDAVLVRSFVVQVDPSWCFPRINDEKWSQDRISHSTFDQRGPLDMQKCDQLFDYSLSFFKAKFGNRFIGAQLHLDETGPHVHCQIIPVTDDGRLCNKEILNGDDECRAFVDELADHCRPIGLDRPRRGGKKSPARVDWEAEGQRQADLINAQNQKMPPRDVPFVTVKDVKESEAPELVRRINGLEREKNEAQRKVVALSSELKKVTSQRDVLSQKYEENKRRFAAEREALKTLDVQQVFVDLYGQYCVKSGKERDLYYFDRNPEKRNIRECDMRIKFTNDLFVENSKDRKISGKGVFSLVMQIEKCSFQDAVAILKKQYPAKTIGVHIATETDTIKKNVEKVPELPKERKVLALAMPDAVKDSESSLYRFANERKINRNVLDFLLSSGQCYADDHKNFVFPRINGGAVLHGSVQPRPGQKSFHRTIGGKSCGPVILRGPYYDNTRPCRLVEGVTDAMAALSKWPESAVVVVGGDLNPTMPENLPGSEVILCFDYDSHGDELTAKYAEMYPAALDERPDIEGQDWSEAWKQECIEQERVHQEEQRLLEEIRIMEEDEFEDEELDDECQTAWQRPDK